MRCTDLFSNFRSSFTALPGRCFPQLLRVTDPALLRCVLETLCAVGASSSSLLLEGLMELVLVRAHLKWSKFVPTASLWSW